MYGIGIECNIEESNSYFKKSADRGNTKGMLQYAFSLLPGKFFKNRKDEANQYIIKSAENGNAISVFKYATICLSEGKFLKASRLFKMAADQEIQDQKKEIFVPFKNILDKLIETAFFGNPNDLEFYSFFLFFSH